MRHAGRSAFLAFGLGLIGGSVASEAVGSSVAAAEAALPLRQLQVVSDAPPPPPANAAFQPPPLETAQQAAAFQQPQPLQPSPPLPVQPSPPPPSQPSLGATTTAAGVSEEEAQSWLSRLGSPSISLIVIAIAAGPACALSVYRRMQMEEYGEGFGGLLGLGCRRTWKADDGSESESDGIN
eukprot:gb/GFBE01009621.1/.p1 GENE.gb/GFBE01009621.1/~~gb/GFBE01009621.1/.p1  ORF type:complete len:181 (+),score=43.90 gb/GFBE01009621.1/:1-543(+)